MQKMLHLHVAQLGSTVGKSWEQHADGPSQYLRYNMGLEIVSLTLTSTLALEMFLKVFFIDNAPLLPCNVHKFLH
jgi:hypothetical protein